MAIDTSIFATDLAAIITDLPSSLVWTPDGGAEQTVSGVASDLIQSEDVTETGYFEDDSRTWQGPIASFADSTTPPINDLVTIDGTEHRVMNTRKTDDGIMVTLTVERVAA